MLTPRLVKQCSTTQTTTLGHVVKSGEKSLEQGIRYRQERNTLYSQIRDLFGRAAYSHKTQEKMADRCTQYQRHIKVGQVWLSGITASGVISSLFVDALWLPYFTAIISLLTLLLTGYAKDIDPGAAAQQHRQTAANIWNVRESYLSLLADVEDPSISTEALRSRRDKLQEQLHVIYKSAPSTDSRAYATAKKALKGKEELTFSSSELDELLPRHLKQGKPR